MRQGQTETEAAAPRLKVSTTCLLIHETPPCQVHPGLTSDMPLVRNDSVGSEAGWGRQTERVSTAAPAQGLGEGLRQLLHVAGPLTQVNSAWPSACLAYPLQGPVGTVAGDPKMPGRPPYLSEPCRCQALLQGQGQETQGEGCPQAAAKT